MADTQKPQEAEKPQEVEKAQEKPQEVEKAQEKPQEVEKAQEKPQEQEYAIQSMMYFRSVEYKDGKLVETKKVVKRKDDKWFLMNAAGEWEPTTEEKTREAPANVVKTIEPPKSCDHCKCQQHELQPLWLTAPRPRWSLFNWF